MPEADNVQYDIKVVSAYKSYGEKNIINGLDMNVPSGSIYGLLGASGCGKSTLLECILEKITLDYGSVHLEVDSLRDIGYMPQELSLEMTLTIQELLEYYGTLYSMTKNEIELRIEFLTNLLELPDINQYLKNLSGGQLRRVSLAVCIIHDPKIIILDEPTVGIDTILRKKIWDEFTRMANDSKKTIIITTHYIEEATKAHCVGLMRNGVLIEEGEPRNILTKYETDSLESAFLSVCCKQEEHKMVQNNVQDDQREKKVHTQNLRLTTKGKPICLNRIKALLNKYKSLITRDYLFLVTVVILPIFMSAGICVSIGSDVKDLKLAVRNEEVELSDCLRFKNDGCILDHTNNHTISCFVINNLRSLDYQIVEVKDKDAGDSMVNNYETIGFLYFSQNYTKYLSDYIEDPSEEKNLKSPIYMNIAGDNLIIKNQFMTDLMDSIKLVMEEALDICSYNKKLLSSPLDFRSVFGDNVKTVLNGVAVLYFATQGFFFTSTFAVSFMITERMDGLFSRSILAGVKVTELLISLFFMCNIFFFLQLIPSLFIFYVWFAQPIIVNGSIFVFFLAIIILGWIGFFYGILAAGLLPSKLAVTFAEHGMFMAQVSLSGFIWPIEGEIFWLRPISEIMPATIAGSVMNSIGLKGFTWDHPLVVNGMAMLIVELVLLILILIGMDKVKKNMWILSK